MNRVWLILCSASHVALPIAREVRRDALAHRETGDAAETSITGKLARGTFAVSFFLACLVARVN
jgi:hypothetical protein